MKKTSYPILSFLICLFFTQLSVAQTSEQLITVNQFNNLAALNAVSNPNSGALAFNLDNNSIYYYDGTTWVQTPSAGGGWNLTGNSVSSSNFLGTTNNQPIRLRANNSEIAIFETRGSISLINPTGSVYIGSNLNGQNSTSSAYENVGIGSGTLMSNTSGSGNVALGSISGGDITTGYHNTAIGVNTVRSVIEKIQNTAIGARAYYTGNYNNSTAIGANVNIGGNNQVRIGNNVSSIGGPVSWTTVSDRRFKENVKDNVLGLDFIMGLNPLTYNFNFKKFDEYQNNSDTICSPEQYKMQYGITQIGFLAQDVEELADSLNFDFHGVDEPDGPTDTYGIRYAEFVVPIVKAIQEQQAILQNQKNEIDELNSVINSLLKRIEKLEH